MSPFKIAFFILTGILFLAGVVLILLGFFAYYDPQNVLNDFTNLNEVLGIACIVLGFGTAIIAVIGILGVTFNNKFLNTIFTGVVSCFVGAMVVLAIISMTVRSDDVIRQTLEAKMEMYANSSRFLSQYLDLDYIQETFKCCGVEKKINIYKEKGYPASCCPTTCCSGQNEKCDEKSAYKDYCDVKIIEATKKPAMWTSIILFVVTGFLVTTLLLMAVS